MAAGELEGFGFPGHPGLEGEGYDEGTDGFDDVQIPVIYQRIFVRPEPDYVHEPDDSDPDSDTEREEQYDLTAPPLESWYHGRISRQTALERLEMVGEPGGYLVRESVGQPGDYAISYLSRLGQVHHFKINSNCGDYYIGGRQFYSLNDLIGFYANCSCILENETLDVPIVPPKPVPLYMMLRANSSHIKTPGTDELTIEVGEVFQLLSLLSDEWGWGRSQASGLSGLIPIVIMDDVTHEDSNLGKPWFHDSVGREEAVEILMKKGIPGSFLVRKGSARAGEDEIHYSMAVRTAERVQRFLITRYATGYYLFGGRPFSSMEEIIERYRSEVILDGLKLGNPLPIDPEVLQQSLSPQKRGSEMLPSQNHARRPSDFSSRPELPGDVTGTLSLKKGKKSPVYGKWKEFHFVVQCKEKKLLYYDQESKHRAKGLLDLRQCKVYQVHPSLLPNCLVVMLKYLNETTFYYLSAASNINEWLRALQHCTHPQEVQDRQQQEIQQARSLNLVVKDCKLAKPNTQVYGLVFIDGACVARTRVMAEVPCVFDEDFYFDNLPLYAMDFACEIHTSRSKRLGSIVGRESCLGRVQVHLSDLPSGQEDDRWHQLMLSNSKTPRGSVRFGALFKDYIILPIKEYDQLKELLLSDDLRVIEALAKVCKDHHAELASTLIHIFCTYDRVVPLINACLRKSVDNEENVSTLFRASTLSTMLMDQLMKLMALDYLRTILSEPVKQIMESPESCEISPANLPKGADPTPNQNRLQDHVSHVLSVIFASVDLCPPTLRYIYHCLQMKVCEKWPKDDTVRIRAVSGFLFLRFVCPALLKPQLFNIVSDPPSPIADRTLKLVTKTIQNLANLVEFKAKESFMIYLNSFIKDHMPLMTRFVDEISNWEDPPESVELDTATNTAKDLSTISHLCYIYNDNLCKLASTQPEIKYLLEVMGALRKAERKYTNRFS